MDQVVAGEGRGGGGGGGGGSTDQVLPDDFGSYWRDSLASVEFFLAQLKFSIFGAGKYEEATISNTPPSTPARRNALHFSDL